MKTICIIQDKNFINDINPNIYLWYGYQTSKNIKSIQKLLEENSYEIRSEILKLLDRTNLEISKIMKSQNLCKEIDRLIFHMSLLSEHSIHKSPYLVDTLKILLLKKIINRNRFKKISYFGDNITLDMSLKALSLELGIEYVFKHKNSKIKHYLNEIKLKFKTFQNQNILRSLVSLIKTTILNIPFIHTEKNSYNHDPNSIFMMSYFSNFNVKKNNFYSNFWGKIPNIILSEKIHLNWHHLFVKSKQYKRSVALKTISFLNRNKKEKHSFIEGYLKWKDCIQILIIWFLCQIKYRLLIREISKNSINKKDFWFWYLCKKDIYSSFLGGIFVTNLFYIISFKNCFRNKKINQGMLLFENHGWEKAFTYFWYKNNNGNLFGVTHYPPRFWDIRILNNLNKSFFNDKIIPDKITVLGKNSLNFFQSANVNASKLIMVEALRYSHINKKLPNIKKISSKPNVFIPLDYDIKTSLMILNDIERNHKDLRGKFKFYFKFHPNNIFKINCINGIELRELKGDLTKIFNKIDIVFSSIHTTTFLESYSYGLPTLIFLDPNYISFPLDGLSGIKFISSSNELPKIDFNKLKPGSDYRRFFYLNEDYPRWKKILLKNKY